MRKRRIGKKSAKNPLAKAYGKTAKKARKVSKSKSASYKNPKLKAKPKPGKGKK